MASMMRRLITGSAYWTFLRNKIGYNMTKYNTIIFDLDGTLLDTLDDLTDAVNYVMDKHDEPTHTREAVRSFVGNGIRNLMIRAIPGGEGCESFEEQFAEFKSYYTAHSREKTRPYAGITDLLKELKERGFATAIVSNKAQEPVSILADEYFGELIDAAVGDGDGRRIKPAPDACEEAMRRLGDLYPDRRIDSDTCLYIGDSDVDAMTAENSGMDYILVSWGFRSRDLLEKYSAVGIADEPEDIAEGLAF